MIHSTHVVSKNIIYKQLVALVTSTSKQYITWDVAPLQYVYTCACTGPFSCSHTMWRGTVQCWGGGWICHSGLYLITVWSQYCHLGTDCCSELSWESHLLPSRFSYCKIQSSCPFFIHYTVLCTVYSQSICPVAWWHSLGEPCPH